MTTPSAPENALVAPTPPASGGPLDAASVKRSWPAVQAEIRRLRPPRAHLFDMSEVEVEGDLLVVEFPKDQQVALDLASDSDTLQLLRRSVGAVLGVTPPIEFRLGRQGTSNTGKPPAASAAPSESVDVAHADMERMLIDELGAEIVAEHENDPVE
jgi:hypothetical protein